MSNLLTLEDFKGKKLNPNSTRYEILVLVMEVAAQKLKDKEKGQQSLVKNEKKVVKKTKEKSPQKDNNSKRKSFKTMDSKEWVKCMTDKKSKRQDDSSASPSNLPEEFQREIINRCGGSRPNRLFRLIQKTLHETDISKRHGRLTIPCNQIESFEFLEDSEISLLRQKETIRVPLIHRPRENGVSCPLTETILKFGQWNLHQNKDDPRKVSSQYVLNGGWNTVVSDDRLKAKATVEVWAFRDIQSRLCMALVELGR